MKKIIFCLFVSSAVFGMMKETKKISPLLSDSSDSSWRQKMEKEPCASIYFCKSNVVKGFSFLATFLGMAMTVSKDSAVPIFVGIGSNISIFIGAEVYRKLVEVPNLKKIHKERSAV